MSEVRGVGSERIETKESQWVRKRIKSLKKKQRGRESERGEGRRRCEGQGVESESLDEMSG